VELGSDKFVQKGPAGATLAPKVARQYQCLEAGCDEEIVAPDEASLIEAVQRHVADKHDSFELEAVIVDMSTEVEGEDNRGEDDG